jgi:hypothetical protein
MIETAPVSIDTLPFDIAWLYCATLTYDNKKDWRLPTFGEYVYDPNTIAGVWHAFDGNNRTSFLRYAQPVRTKDD